MNRKIGILLLTLTAGFLMFNISHLPAETDLYSFPKIDETPAEKPKRKVKKDPFAQILAERTGVSEPVVLDAITRGFGRSELIRLILISQKSKKDLQEILKQREKGTRLKKIAKQAGVEHDLIRKEALQILKELEKPVPATAGVFAGEKKD